MTNILEVKELYKSFGALPAVNHLSFAVQPGKIVGLLGPNGCGKSTTMKIAAGLIKGYRGEVLIDGRPVGPQSKAMVSYLPEKFNKTIAGKSYIYPLIPFSWSECKKRFFRGRLPHK